MSKRKFLYFIVWVVLLANEAIAQFPLFQDGDRVCFIGNSITMNGRFHNYIELFYITRFPDRKIEFYNCGISGDVSGGILRRMDSDILIHKPTWSVLMVGMNDINSSLYSKAKQREPGIKQLQQNALNRYFKNVDSIVRLLLRANSKVVLQTPSIYDQTAVLSTESNFGANDALKRCADYLRQLALKYKLTVVDYWTAMSAVNSKVQKTNPQATLISSDRVHPGIEGHFFMAGEFLKTQGAPAYVSFISIDAGKHKIRKSVQCKISGLQYGSWGSSFTSVETSLPYPLLSENFNPDSLFSFTDNFNKEILQLTSLREGKYELSIDNAIVGIYSEKDFNRGINLSTNKLTPQYSQSQKVLNHCEAYWDLKRKLRGIKYAEYQHLRNMKEFNDIEKIKKVFASNLEGYKISQPQHLDYYKESYENYLKNKPMEKDMEMELTKQLKEIRKINKPVQHNYKITKTK